MMITLKGQGVCNGIAFGNIHIFKKEQNKIKRYHIEDAESEVKRFEDAKERATAELGSLYEKALAEVGEAEAMIFQIHQMMLDDLDYCDSIRMVITNEKLNAETAVGMTADNFAEMFSSMDDAYMKERAADVRDVSERLLSILSGAAKHDVAVDEPVIIAADDLAPSETVQLDKSKILAFVTKGGSYNSHTSILARTMNIPAVIGAGEEIIDDIIDGAPAIVDGYTGDIYISPDAATTQKMRQKEALKRQQFALLKQLKGQKSITKDGQELLIYANIGNVADTGAAIENDAQGIGLFRSEFLYLENTDYPSEEEQFFAYKTVLEHMESKRVIIRTLDIGADKQVDYFNMPKEENPAMGVRAIRICLSRPDVFKTQLRALYRASVFGRLGIMFPMIVSLEEVHAIKQIVEEVKSELSSEGLDYSDNIELGIMIETPASAVISDILAKEVDFFSIGTNDLMQYTLAADRQNNAIAPICNPHHKAILRLIKLVAENAHKNGIWVGICGELGSDLSLTETFLSMGIDELSVSPSAVLPIRKKVRETDVSAIRDGILNKINH
jgi:phosphotransferase system enzyme I (PtsI)